MVRAVLAKKNNTEFALGKHGRGGESEVMTLAEYAEIRLHASDLHKHFLILPYSEPATHVAAETGAIVVGQIRHVDAILHHRQAARKFGPAVAGAYTLAAQEIAPAESAEQQAVDGVGIYSERFGIVEGAEYPQPGTENPGKSYESVHLFKV